MVLEHGIKHCLPWTTDQWDVRGYKTCQDNFGGLQKDWKKPVLLLPLFCILESCHYPTTSGESDCWLQKIACIHASSANSWGNWDRNATKEQKFSNNTQKGRVGRLPQSYLLQSTFLPTLNGQATRWDENTGSWPNVVVAVLWFFTNTRKLILSVFAILMMRETPQMTEFCELQSKDWYTVTKNKKKDKSWQDMLCSFP